MASVPKGPVIVSEMWLFASCGVTVALMIHAAGGVFQPSGFYLWALVPYLALGWRFFRASGVGPAVRRARKWASCAVFIGGA
jgi:hypothetical protein